MKKYISSNFLISSLSRFGFLILVFSFLFVATSNVRIASAQEKTKISRGKVSGRPLGDNPKKIKKARVDDPSKKTIERVGRAGESSPEPSSTGSKRPSGRTVHSIFGINYATLEESFRTGTVPRQLEGSLPLTLRWFEEFCARHRTAFTGLPAKDRTGDILVFYPASDNSLEPLTIIPADVTGRPIEGMPITPPESVDDNLSVTENAPPAIDHIDPNVPASTQTWLSGLALSAMLFYAQYGSEITAIAAAVREGLPMVGASITNVAASVIGLIVPVKALQNPGQTWGCCSEEGKDNYSCQLEDQDFRVKDLKDGSFDLTPGNEDYSLRCKRIEGYLFCTLNPERS